MLGVDFGRDEFDRLGYALGKDYLEVFDDLIHLGSSLRGRNDQVFQSHRILVRDRQHMALSFQISYSIGFDVITPFGRRVRLDIRPKGKS